MNKAEEEHKTNGSQQPINSLDSQGPHGSLTLKQRRPSNASYRSEDTQLIVQNDQSDKTRFQDGLLYMGGPDDENRPINQPSNQLAPSSQTPGEKIPSTTAGMGLEQDSSSSGIMEWWPMRIGAVQGKTRDELAGLNDNDVYPMSIQYTRWERQVMTTTRFVTLLALFYLFIPYDLYVTPQHKRLGYFGTDYYTQTVMFSDLTNNTFNFNLTKCQVYLYALDSSYTDRFQLEYGFLYGDRNSFSKSRLTIESSSSTSCIVNLMLSPTASLPQFIFLMGGTSTSSTIDDYHLNGTALNFASGLTITGESCNLNLNKHNISSLQVNLKASVAYLRELVCPSRVVLIYSGLISEYIAPSQTKNFYTLNQTDGYICLYSPFQSVDNTACTSASLAKKSCGINATVCTNAAKCESPSPGQTSSFTLLDGPIQIRYPSEAFSTTKSGRIPQSSYTPIKLNSTVIFTTSSKKIMNDSRTNYEKDSTTDRMSLFYIYGAGIQRTFAFTNKKVYFQSQFWPIVWASLGLLYPPIDDSKYTMIDSVCPERGSDLLAYMDSDINDYLYEYYPTTTTTEVALVSGYSTFYRVHKDVEGNIFYNKIAITENQLLVAAFGVSAAIGVVGAILVVQVMIMAFKIFTKRYSEWVSAQRGFAITKRQFEVSQEKGGSYEESVKFEMLSKLNVLEVRGLFTSSLRAMTQDDIKKGVKFQFSIFQVPTLAIDYTLRANADSLTMFLLKVPQNKQHFSAIRMKGPVKKVSISLADFQQKYSDFCIKQGYQEIDIENEGLDTFEVFGIKLDNQLGQELPAYGNIRFKTMKEKSQQTLMVEKGESIVDQFLNEECIQSSFPTDYILNSDLAQAFTTYCDRQGVEAGQRENIVGSESLAMFGAVKREVPPPYYLIGVKEEPESENNAQDKNITGLMRIQSGKKSNYLSGLLSSEGVIANAAMTIVHFAIILAIPIITPVLSYSALSAMSQVSEGQNQIPIAFYDFYTANRLNPWWKNVPYLDVFLYIQISVIVFVVLGLIELVSFYLTGFENQGKCAITYTWPKKFFSWLLKIVICLFLFAYFCYCWFGLVWAILAAIINPTQFLPYATASITFMTVLASKLVLVRSQYQNAIRNFDRILTEKLNLIIESSILKLKKLSRDALGSVQIPYGNEVFQKELNQHFDRVFDNASKTMGEMVREGGMSKTAAIAKIASNALDGLQNTVIELCIGVITKNVIQIEDSLKKLSIELNMDYGLLESIVEIVLNDYNPDVLGQDEKLGQAEIQIKKLFRKLIPTMDVEPVGELLYILIRGDVSKLSKFLDELEQAGILGKQQEIYSEIFKMLICQISNDKDGIKNQIVGFLNKVKSNKQLQNLDDVSKAIASFETLQSLKEGDAHLLQQEIDLGDNANVRAQMLKFENNFPLLFLVTLSKRSSTLTNEILGIALKELENVNQMVSPEQSQMQQDKYLTSEQKQKPLEKFLMSLYIAINGKTMDMSGISSSIRKKDPGFDVNLLKMIHLCSNNSAQSFKTVVYGLGCAKQLNVLMELYDIMFFNNSNPVNILRVLEADQDQNKVFLNLVYALYYILKYEILYNKRKQRMEKRKGPSETSSVQSGDGGSGGIGSEEFSTIRKKLISLLPYLKKKLRITDFTNHKNFFEIKKLIMSPPQKSQKVKLGGENLSSQGSSTVNGEDADDILLPGFGEQKREEAGNLNDDRKLDNLIRHAFANPSHQLFDAQYHRIIWETLIESDQLKKVFNERVMSVVRCCAIIMLRNEFLLSQDNKDYEKCFKSLADEMEISYEQFEFLIDIMSGHPLDIFKASPKQPQYSLKNEDEFQVVGQKSVNCFINARFDGLRLNLLADLLRADKSYMPFACLKWYHSYRFFKASFDQVSLLMRFIGIKGDFYELMDLIKLEQRGSIGVDPLFIEDKFIHYLERQLQGRKQGIKVNDDYQEMTDLTFITEEQRQSSVIHQGLDESQIRYIQEIPFLQSKENDTSGLLDIMQQFLMAKKCSRTAIYKILYGKEPVKLERTNEDKQREHSANILTELLLGIRGQAKPSKSIIVVHKLSNLVQTFGTSRQISLQDKNLFVQFGLLINALQLKTLCETVTINRLLMEQALDEVLDLVNGARAEVLINRLDEIDPLPQENYPTLVQSLYQVGFFTEISRQLMSILDVDNKKYMTDKVCNSIVGALLGSAVDDLELLRFSVIQMLENHPLNLSLLTGIAAALTRDIKAESNIKQLCKSAELDGQLLLNLLDFLNDDTQNLPLVLQHLLSHVTKDQAKVCGSLIHIIKKDIAMCAVIAERFFITPEELTPVLAATLGDFDSLPEHYSSMAKKFELDNPQSVQYLLQLVHCKTSCIDELRRESTTNFILQEPDLVKSIYIISYNGKQMLDRNYSHFNETITVGNAYSILGKKLSQQLGLAKGQSNHLMVFISQIIPACWNSSTALTEVLNVLRASLPASSFWSKDFKVTPKNAGLSMLSQSLVLNFLNMKLRKIGEDFAMLKETIQINQKKLIQLLKVAILPELFEKLEEAEQQKQTGDFSATFVQNADEFQRKTLNNEESEEMSKKLEPLQQKMRKEMMAFKIGCTFGIGLKKNFTQPFFICEDCNTKLSDSSLVICVSCALTCHRGHKLRKGNYGQPGKVACHCGEGKFNSCPDLNKNNPISEYQSQRTCAISRNGLKKVQEDAFNEVFVKGDIKSRADLFKSNPSKALIVTDTEDNYTTFEMLKDLSQAFDLPEYFGVSQSLVNQNEVASQFSRNDSLKYFEGMSFLRDSYLDADLSLAQQIIMMAFGQTTQSMLSIVAGSRGFDMKSYKLQSEVANQDVDITDRNKYRTLSAFTALAQIDFVQFAEFGDTLQEAFQESGQDKVQKMCEVIRLCKGATLPSLRDFEDQIVKATPYMKVMQKFYGGGYQRILSLHILLQLGRGNLLKALGVDRTKSSSPASQLENLANIRDWIDQYLFKQTLQLENKPQEYIKNVLGTLCQSMESLDYVLRENKVHPKIASMYKAILKQDAKELQPIFESVKKMIPDKFNKFMIKVWQGDKQALILFIVKFLEMNSAFSKSWETVDEADILSQKQEDQKEYLTKIYELLCEDDFGKKHKIEYVLSRVHARQISRVDGLERNTKAIIQKSSYALQCVSAVFYNSVSGLQEIAHTLFDQTTLAEQETNYEEWRRKYQKLVNEGNPDAKARSQLTRLIPDPRRQQNQMIEEYIPRPPAKKIINSLALLINGDWDLANLQTLLEAQNIESYFYEELPMSYIIDSMKACQGDLVSLAKIDDEILRGGNTHLRSLMASLVTGTTKFDNLEQDLLKSSKAAGDEGAQAAIRQTVVRSNNLLLREIYRIFEKLVSNHNKWENATQESIKGFISWSFQQKIPLYLIMALRQDINFVNKLFAPESEFQVNMLDGTNVQQQEKNKNHLLKLLEFFDPFSINPGSIQALLQNITNQQNLRSVQINKIGSIKLFAQDDIAELQLKPQNQERKEILKIDNEKDDAKTIRNKQAINKQMKIYENIKQEFGLENAPQHIKLDLLAFFKMLSRAYELDVEANQSLFQIFVRLFDNDLVLQNIYSLIYKVATKQKVEMFECISSVTALIVASSKRKMLDKKDQDIIMMITKWMHVAAIMLDKEKKFSEMDDEVRNTIKEALTCTIKCADVQAGSAIAKFQDDMSLVVDIVFGIISLCRHDFKKMRSIAIKVGGFPNIQRLESFFYMIKKNRDAINFGSGAVGNAVGAVVDALPAENSLTGMDARAIFNHFCKKGGGKIGMEEFSEIVKYMGLNLNQAETLQIFSKVDSDKSGDLNFAQFQRSFSELRKKVILEVLANLGLSIGDLVRAFITTMVTLVLLFVFIFISINAFAAPTTFSSVTNSLLPIVAGGAATKSGSSKSNDTNAQEEAVDDVIK